MHICCIVHVNDFTILNMFTSRFFLYSPIFIDESRNVTDLGIFINIFSMRSVYHLQQVIIEYQNFYSDSLENAIEKVFSGPIMTALVTVGKNKKMCNLNFLYMNCYV